MNPKIFWGRHKSIGPKEEVVVVGGIEKSAGCQNSKYHKTTEIYSVEDDSWRTGPPFTHDIYTAASVPYYDTFLIVGGKKGCPADPLDTIYQVFQLHFELRQSNLALHFLSYSMTVKMRLGLCSIQNSRVETSNSWR